MGRRLVRSLAAATLLALVVVIAARAARADDTERATRLFTEGRALLDRNDVEGAYARFNEAATLAPRGAGILINLALCEERLGRPVAAYEHYQRAASVLEPSDDRRPFALDHAKALRPKVALLRITASGAPSGLQVVRDDRTLGPDDIGQEEAVDPGPHTVDVQSPGRAPRRYAVTLGAGDARTLAVAPGDAAVGTSPAEPEGAPAADAEERRSPARSNGRAAAMYVVGGVAVAMLVPGIIFEISGFSKRSDLDSCKGSCSQDQVDSAKSTMLTGDVFLAVGLIAAGTATYLWVTRPGAPNGVAVAPLPGGACAAASWRF
jgi:hypothetical protein